MSKISKVVSDNKDLATTAAIFEAGRIANNKAAQLISKQVPMMVRGYVDTPFGKLAMANVVKLAVEQFKPDNELAQRLVNGMVVAAYQEVLQSFDLEGMLDSLINDQKVSGALRKVIKSEE